MEFRDYAAWNHAGEALIVRSGQPYVLLRPPAVPKPLFVLADQSRSPALDAEFRSWCDTPEANAPAVLDDDAVRAKVAAEIGAYYGLPGREEVLRCKWFAHAAQTPTAMYGAETFGGVPGCSRRAWSGHCS